MREPRVEEFWATVLDFPNRSAVFDGLYREAGEREDGLVEAARCDRKPERYCGAVP
jgi:hypothetical protein